MNVASQSPPSGFWGRSWSTLNSGLVVALIVALLGWGFQFYLTRQASTQTFNLTRVSELSTDGEKLDKAVISCLNSVSENPTDFPKNKDLALQAIVDHSLKVESLRSVIGDKPADSYLADLANLRDQIEITVDPLNAGANRTAFGRVIEKRRALIDNVRTA